MMNSDTTAMPSELLATPQPLVGLMGLEVTTNAIHRAIWEAFNANCISNQYGTINRKIDGRASIHYKLLPYNCDFPVPKPKRTSYEWYQPRGILKRNWMHKHLQVLPAVIAIFQHFEWNDPNWLEKQKYCATLVQTIRTGLQKRDTRICLVLLQKSPPMPPGEDPIGSERASSLVLTCGINSQMLFILPYSDSLAVYILQLESAFISILQSYYDVLSARINNHVAQLTSAHTTLKVRLLFKLAFIAELQQNLAIACKYYNQAYVILDEIRITEANNLEIKTIASFLNYKICHLKFKLSYPKHAINNFHNHIEKYKSRINGKDLLFEQYAWLCTQYTTFADIFSEAIKNGVQSVQTQHPGIYYQKAAEFTQKRKESFQQSLAAMNSQLSEFPSLQNMSVAALQTEYFGIRNLKNIELQNEMTVNLILIEFEKQFDHSAAYINLLSQAMNQYKICRCLRFRKKLTIDMADEYFKIGDISNALIFYTLMLLDYRQDKWPALFLDVLLKTHNCALLSASINDFVSCCIELLSSKILYPLEKRIQALEDVQSILNRKVPALTCVNSNSVYNDDDHHEDNEMKMKLTFQWQEALNQAKTPIHLDLDKITDIIEVCATFEQTDIKANDLICLNLIIKSHMEIAVPINILYVIITDGLHQYLLQPDKFYVVESLMNLRTNSKYYLAHPEENCQQMGSNFLLKPSLYYIFLFHIESNHFIENSQLRVLRYEFYMCSDQQKIRLTQTQRTIQSGFISHNCRSDKICDNIVARPICYIAPTFQIITQYIPCLNRMLVNEYYPITLTVTNPYKIILSDIKISFSIPQQYKNKVFLAIDTSCNKQKLHSNIELELNELTNENNHCVTFYMYSLVEDVIILEQKITYTMKLPVPKFNEKLLMVTEKSRTDSNENSPEMDNNDGDIGCMHNKNIFPNKDHLMMSNVFSYKGVTTTAGTITGTGAGMAALMPGTDSRLKAINSNNTNNFSSNNIELEYLEKNFVRKTQISAYRIHCGLEFEFIARFYTLDKRPLINAYRGENFLLRINIQLKTNQDIQLDILETYFVCDHNLTQSNYTRHRKKFGRTYSAGDTFEDVYILQCSATSDEWLNVTDYEKYKNMEKHAETHDDYDADSNERDYGIFRQLESSRRHTQRRETSTTLIVMPSSNLPNPVINNSNNSSSSNYSNSKNSITNNFPSNNSSNQSNNNNSANLNTITMPNSGVQQTVARNVISKVITTSTLNPNVNTTVKVNCVNTHLIYNKTLDALQNTGHLRGFIRANIITENTNNNIGQQQQQQPQQFNTNVVATNSNNTIVNSNNSMLQQQQHQQHIFGIYCIKWKRTNTLEENETKFAINGVPVLEPPLIIHCELEERMYVKMPITLKITLRNPTHQILHLIANLNQFSTENFICSGHKEIDVSIMAFGEKELVYNLYPLYVGWQLLPELVIEYNTQADPSKDESQNNLLAELVERSMPKRIYVLPPLKQQPK